GRDGLALVRHIRRVPQPFQSLSSRLPILVMAGFEDVASLAEALRDGADDFISKPFSREEFVLRLHRVLQPEFLPEANDASVPEPMMRAVSG
ncbi:response regulator, partial [Salmonella enterica subsp. enterica]|nr:response regulator [Salmonella enterica]